MSIEAYLERLGHRGPVEPTAATLRAMHAAHQQAVPFENLDVALGRPVSLATADLLDKVVARHRGGFCYELNGLFAWLLGELGFTVDLLSARVRGERGLGPAFDHMALAVTVEGQVLLADVGFGDSFREPLPLVPGIAVTQGAWRYSLEPASGGDELVLARERDGQPAEAQYHVSAAPRRLDDYLGMCDFHQQSPLSPFTQRVICSRATAEGRVTLAGRRLITTAGTAKQESMIADAKELDRVLAGRFGVTLATPDIARLWERIAPGA